ncbi:MAG: hypothetical protein IT206_03490 [Fimbriimonadaceae bacterium]|nr:hypothetical protein [Fimbriimonadaceae bacterium]
MTNISAAWIRNLSRSMKSCPLCHNLNLRASDECYVCGWRGTFEHDAETIRLGIEDLADRAPQLLEVLCVAANARRNTRLPRLLKALFVRIDCRV